MSSALETRAAASPGGCCQCDAPAGVKSLQQKKKRNLTGNKNKSQTFSVKKKDALMEISMSQTIKSVYFIIISSDFSVPIFHSF